MLCLILIAGLYAAYRETSHLLGCYEPAEWEGDDGEDA
jgi:hypothetical protein